MVAAWLAFAAGQATAATLNGAAEAEAQAEPTGAGRRVVPSATPAEADTADLSLEELLKTEVVTVARKPQSLQSTAAAAFVISRDDIERSGAASLPEALRLAPGVQVRRLSTSRWAVGVRGFNGRFANKLLVMVDGRSVYSPLFSGVLWEYEDTLLEDVERIEVIRGPGAALWGANAVNGVINIITRKARDTLGDMVVLSAGSRDSALAAWRHGQASGEGDGAGHLRVWGKAVTEGDSTAADGSAGHDGMHASRLGFRGDWPLAGGNRLTLSGGAYDSATPDRWNVPDLRAASGAVTANVQQTSRGLHLLARHEWALGDGSEAALQATFTHEDLDVQGFVRQRRATLDLDFQHRPRSFGRHDVVWGLGWRHSPDHIDAGVNYAIDPARRSFELASAYVQDEIELSPALRLTLGARLEHNNLTGFEPQPNVRLAWAPAANVSVWTALSRAARTPSRAEIDGSVNLSVTPAAPPRPAVVLRSVAPGLGGLQSERVDTLELGARHQLDARLSLDAAAFSSRYADLRSARLAGTQLLLSPGGMPYVQQTMTTDNGLRARSHGLELAAEWLAAPWWRLQPQFTWFRIAATPADADPVHVSDAAGYATGTPRRQWSLRSAMSFAGRRQLDLWLRHVDGFGRAATGGPAVPAYTTLDARLAWRVTPGFELSLVGQNLLQRHHAEGLTELLPSLPLLVDRSGHVKARWQF